MSSNQKPLTVTVVGAGGKMGTRITENLRKFDGYRLLCCETGRGIESVERRGLKVTEKAEAFAQSEVVVLAVPDSLLQIISAEAVPMLRPDTTAVILDPAAAYAKELTLRGDCTFVATHPSHPPLFMKQDSDEAREDTFGGIAAKQYILLAKISGKDANYSKAKRVCIDMFHPVVKAFEVTVDQMAFLEPACSETVGAACCYVLSQAVEEAVKAGIEREAAQQFMLGHLNVLLSMYFGVLKAEPSDACKVAVKCGTDLVFREDWRDVFKPEVNRRVVETMLAAGRKR
jgi:hypothetical protein